MDSISTPPLTPSRRSPQPAQQPTPRPAQRDDIQSQVDSITLYFQSLSVNLTYQLSDFLTQFLCQSQSSPPFAAPRASTRQAPRPPPAFEDPPQPSTSGWVPPRSRHDSEASESESVTSARDSASASLAALIYEVCLTLALSSIRRLRGAGSRPGLVSQRLRPRSSASECTLALLRYRRRLLLGRSLWLDAPSLCRVWSLRVRARTLWQMTLSSRHHSLWPLHLPSLRVQEFSDPGVGVLWRFRTWNDSNACSRVS